MRSDLKEGYVTVEAVILVPTLLACFVLLLYLTIYAYDRTILFQDTYTMAVYAKEEYFGDKKEYLNAMDEHFKEIETSRPYLSMKNVKMSLSKRGDKITIESSGYFYTPFGNSFFRLFGSKNERIEISEEEKLYDPVNIMLMTKDLVE